MSAFLYTTGFARVSHKMFTCPNSQKPVTQRDGQVTSEGSIETYKCIQSGEVGENYRYMCDI